MNLKMKNGNVTIDGKSFSGKNIQINGNKVIVDGVVQDGELVGDITVTVHGDVDVLENTNGNVTCETVHGDVKTINGDVNCRNILGKVSTVNGDIN